jgi:ribosome-associated heat shock protein Hsp15
MIASLERTVRIDKFLWSVRIFKTRSIATEACRNGRVIIDKIQVKPSREVKLGDKIRIRLGAYTREIEVTVIIDSRVSGRMALECYNDITPLEEKERQTLIREMNYEKRDQGVGRPSKKDRRQIDQLKNDPS